MRTRKPKKPFMSVYKLDPDKPSDPNAWRAAFRGRMGMDAALAAVKESRKTPRGILGVDRNADWDAIKAAYRKLAKLHHPDIGGDPAVFRSVQASYEVLEDARDSGRLSSIQ